MGYGLGLRYDFHPRPLETSSSPRILTSCTVSQFIPIGSLSPSDDSSLSRHRRGPPFSDPPRGSFVRLSARSEPRYFSIHDRHFPWSCLVPEFTEFTSRLAPFFLHPEAHPSPSFTVACLLFFSVNCTRLRMLTVHFNTTNIVDDFNHTFEDPQFRELRSLPRCPLMCFDAHSMPLHLDEPDFETVVNGMLNIFPSLHKCSRGREGLEGALHKNFQHRGGGGGGG
jgi:hypothetical protein